LREIQLSERRKESSFMKKENRKSTIWLMGGLAALMFLGSGSMAAAQTVTSYNDLAWGTGQLDTNITTFTSPVGGSGLFSSGQLKNFATGNATAVTLAVTGGFYNGASNATQGANPTTGDALAIFDGKVNGLGVLSYVDDVSNNLVLTFTNMDQNKVYDLTFFADRNSDGWDRASLVTISGQDDFMNVSSVATDNPDTVNYPGGVLFTGPTSPSTRLPSENPNGYVARFNNIKSGSDGEVVLTISFDGAPANQYEGKYGSAIRLIESSNTNHHFGDLDGDGKDDIVWRNTSTGAVQGWLMNGLAIASSGSIATVGGSGWTIVGVGDLDGNGKDDIVWRNTTTGVVSGWLMNGLAIASSGPIATVGDPGWTIVGVGDLDGNGKDDIVWRNTSTGAVQGWLMNGLAIASSGTIATVGGPGWTIRGVGDLDGNGKDDIVWRNTTTGVVSGWLMNALAIASSGTIATVGGPGWTIRGVGDLDGNGKDDIVWRNTSTGVVSGWLMNALAIASSGPIATVGDPGWTIRGVGDLDGNGKDDIVWRNMSTGAVSGWLMNGLAIASSGPIATVGDPGWEIRP
jgi:FG-GAP-like repeat